jgi:gliding motility-associated-like protein
VNTSVDYTHIKWDFGDGFTSDNVNTPSHVYEKPGKYLVKLFVTGYNGLEKTYIDSVFVRDNTVNISADMVRTCTAESVTLSALSKDATSYLWDFGDGTLAEASDTFSVHYYKTPGNYIPKLIAKDADGCASSVVLTNKISIDSLNVSLKSIPQICAPKEIQFNPDITNIGSGEGDQPLLQYHWDFGTGNKKDTANVESPLFTYQFPGNYKVTLQIQSPAGCRKQTDMEIVALQGLGGEINGPSDICEQSSVQFSGSTLLPGAPTWKWIFEDGTVVNQKNPPAKIYNLPGNFMVQLVVNNSGCADTVNKLLQVHSKPVITLSAKNETLCEGASFAVSAKGGDSYTWSPSGGLNTTNGAEVTASPVTNTNYTVSATNVYGCTDTDSVSINVIHPFSLKLANEISVCSGAGTRLEASGGIAYQWINNTQGLDNITVSAPVASPLTTTTYTVVATGEKQCFSDTATIKVVVNPSPLVQLGKDTSLCQGQSITLNAFNSNAVYSWQDGSTSSSFVVKNGGEYHVKVDLGQCTASDTIRINQMAIPYFSLGKDTSICDGEQYVLKPSVTIYGSFLWQDGSDKSSLTISKEGMYSLAVSNQCGTFTDSVVISSGFCNILMPTGFTPNNDGLNDVFRVKYPFAVKSFHMLVYNAWGEKVFETNKINEGWDGTFKGEPSMQGVYVWVISYVDNNNKGEQLKGVVTLLR